MRVTARGESLWLLDSWVWLPASPGIVAEWRGFLLSSSPLDSTVARSEMKRHGLRLAAWCLLALAAACAQMARAHEFKLDAVLNAFVKIEPGEVQLVIRGPLYLFRSAKFPIRNNTQIDVDKSGPAIERSLAAIKQSITLFENGRPLVASRASGRLSLPSDRSFESYEEAASHVSEPPEPDTSIYIDQGYVDATVTYPISSPNSVFAIRTPFAAGLGDLKVSLRYMPLGEDSRAMVFTSLSGIVALNPTWVTAAAGFIRLGIEHILTGYDHLLFLLCLVIPLRGWRQILSVITVFTVAHSFTLLGSAFNLAPSGKWFPPFVEAAIAASIVYMALENIMGVDLKRRVLITGLFGLVHGFGFSYGLQENFQYAGTHLLVSLFGVQRRHRNRPGHGPGGHAACARRAAALCAAGARRHDHPVGHRRPDGLAVDDRAREHAEAGSMAAADRGGAGDPCVLGRRHPARGCRHPRHRETDAVDNAFRGATAATARRGLIA